MGLFQVGSGSVSVSFPCEDGDEDDDAEYDDEDEEAADDEDLLVNIQKAISFIDDLPIKITVAMFVSQRVSQLCPFPCGRFPCASRVASCNLCSIYRRSIPCR